MDPTLPIAGIIGIIVILFIYILPSIIAAKRDHPNRVAIVFFNIFLGWTFLGWVLAFVWSLTTTGNETKGQANEREGLIDKEDWELSGPDTKICPYCAEKIKIDAKKCRFCGEWIEISEEYPK